MAVEFLEKPGEESLVLRTNDGSQKMVLTQTAAKGIEIVSEGDVSVKGLNVSIEATNNLDLKGVNVKLAGTKTDISGSATTTVTGAIVKIN